MKKQLLLGIALLLITFLNAQNMAKEYYDDDEGQLEATGRVYKKTSNRNMGNLFQKRTIKRNW